MTDKTEQWRAEFDELSSKYFSCDKSKNHYGQYQSIEARIAWEHYLAARKKGAEEIELYFEGSDERDYEYKLEITQLKKQLEEYTSGKKLDYVLDIEDLNRTLRQVCDDKESEIVVLKKQLERSAQLLKLNDICDTGLYGEAEVENCNGCPDCMGINYDLPKGGV